MAARRETRDADSAHLRASLEKSLGRRTQSASVRSLPPLDDLVLPTLAEPPPITDADVERALGALSLSLAPRRPRASGEAVTALDLVSADVVLFHSGAPVPGGVWALRDAPVATSDERLAGLSRLIVGVAVGASAHGAVTMPSSGGGQPGLVAVAAVAIRGALELGAAPQGPALARAAGFGESLAALRTGLRASLEQDRREEHALALSLALADEVAARAVMEGVRDAADVELRRVAWAQEGDLLRAVGATPAEIDAAIERWLSDAMLVEEAERRARRTLLLRAIVESQGLTVDAETRQAAIDIAARAAGVASGAALLALRSAPEDHAQLDALLLPGVALAWLRARAR